MARAFIRKTLGGIVRAMPPGIPEFIYANILRGPLRTIFNKSILSILPSSITIPEGTIALNPEDPIVSGSLAFGSYEPFESALFRETVKPGMTVVDIGANIGYYTIIASKQAGRVIAFEPEPHNYHFLTESIAATERINIETYQVAIADKKGILKLNLFEDNKGKHSLVKDASDARRFSASIEVPTITLDEFLSEKNILHVDLIKMDIEGAESLALSGMQKTLSSCWVLFMEFTPTSIRKAGHEPEAVLKQLQQTGFTLYEINERTRSVQPIKNIEQFTNKIPLTHARNLMCKK